METYNNFEKDNENNDSNMERYISRHRNLEKENSGSVIKFKKSESSLKNRKITGEGDYENEPDCAECYYCEYGKAPSRKYIGNKVIFAEDGDGFDVIEYDWSGDN